LRKRKVISNTKIKNNFLKEKYSLVFKYQKSQNEIPSLNVEKRSFAETKYFHLFSLLFWGLWVWGNLTKKPFANSYFQR